MNLRTYLDQGQPLLFDGSMGTYFASLPGHGQDRCERANLEHPEDILSIHKAYLEAGCKAIKTNTFSLGSDLGGEDEALDIAMLQAACRLAKEAAVPYQAFVFADMGPAPESRRMPPAQRYRRLAELFLAEGITHFLLETLPSDSGVAEFSAWLKGRCPDAYLIVSYAVDFDGITRDGRMGAALLRDTAVMPGVDSVGFNCVSGPHHLLEYIKTLNLGDITLSVMPNAGYPTVLGRRTFFQGKPEYFSDKMLQIVQSGVKIVGGCCGTTPQHIEALARQLTAPLPKILPKSAHQHDTTPTPQPNPLWDKLERGERVIAVELDPPADDNISFFLSGVRTLRDAGADLVTIADCPIGRPRADSSLLACKIRRELGVEPLPHMTCRDRNLNATKALLLGLSMEGVHNVLLVTGDPIPTEDRDEVKSVFNFNSRKLARYVSSLNEHTLTTPFRMFGALNLNARNFAHQLEMAVEKETCGVSGFLTQPVLSAEALENLKLARSVLKGKILGGIFPVVSYRNACFLNNEISGMRVCDEIIGLYEGKSKEEAEELAITISTAIAREIAPYIDGYYFMTPFRRVELITKILANVEKI